MMNDNRRCNDREKKEIMAEAREAGYNRRVKTSEEQ